MIKRYLCILLALLPIPLFAAFDTISLKDHYPQKYVVEEGDTIYEIAGKYLNKPWEWKKLWHDNPHIKNPLRLYPGTILELRYHDGKPYLTRTRGGTYKLSPHARPRPAQKAIPPIHLKDIRPFLDGSRVFDEDELATAGYVVGYVGEHMVGGQNNDIYVKNLSQYGKTSFSFSIYHPGGVYRDPKKPSHILGFIATYVGNAQLIRQGEPATLELVNISRGVRVKDRVIPDIKPEFEPYFEPKAPDVKVYGSVIDLFGGLVQIGTDQIIVIDLGKQQGLVAGDVVAIWLKSRVIEDPMDRTRTIRIPKERVGEAMVFRSFTHTSYALIMESTRAVNKGAIITNP